MFSTLSVYFYNENQAVLSSLDNKSADYSVAATVGDISNPNFSVYIGDPSLNKKFNIDIYYVNEDNIIYFVDIETRKEHNYKMSDINYIVSHITINEEPEQKISFILNNFPFVKNGTKITGSYFDSWFFKMNVGNTLYFLPVIANKN